MVPAMIKFVLSTLVWGQAFCALKLASYYGPHMVLQRAPQRAVLWGTASKEGDHVSALIKGQGPPVTTTVQNGEWKLKLPAIADPGPFVINVSSSEGFVTLSDVLFGDVWLCSGQSNMEFPYNHIINASTYMQRAVTHDTIRLLLISHAKNETPQRTVQVSAPWNKPTNSTLTKFAAVCLLFAEYLQPHINRPLGMVQSSWSGTSIEAWSPPEAVSACPKVTHGGTPPPCCPYDPIILWNGMMNPLKEMTLFGALWYQGETNVDHPDIYVCQMIQLVKTWRQRFHNGSLGETPADFPFGYVQLAARDNTSQAPYGFPPLRWAQTANHGYSPNSDLPKTFMAVAMDLPDIHSPFGAVHGRYKQEVAERLMLGALNVAYGHHDVPFQGPFPTSLVSNHEQHTLTIEYDNGKTPLEIRAIQGFEICCNTRATPCPINGLWIPAPIKSHDTSHVTLDTSGCIVGRNLTGVRYEWRVNPCPLKQCAIYAADSGLPAPQYIANLTSV